MAQGVKTGGRQKGVPNKITGEAREVFRRMFNSLAPDVEGWIRTTADGEKVTKVLKDGGIVEVRMGADPAKAAELALRLAEFHLPKLGRTELTGADGEKLSVTVSIN